MEIRILDDVFLWLLIVRNRPIFLARKKKRRVLRRVAGGANGLGEHIRSFTTDETYTPKARTMSNLIVRVSTTANQRVRRHEVELTVTHPRPISGSPKKNMAGKTVMKNVWVP